MTTTDYWRKLADVKEVLAKRDWFMGTSGNLSIRTNYEPTQFLVTASGKDKSLRTDEDFLLVDAAGNPVKETHLKPSAETLLHCAIYEKTNAGCGLHVHTVANNVISHLYAKQGEVRYKNQELIKAFGLWEQDDELVIPIIFNHAHIPTLVEAFKPLITRDYGAVLIHSHGITTWGKDSFEAKKLLEAAEFLFQYEMNLLQIGVNKDNQTFSHN